MLVLNYYYCLTETNQLAQPLKHSYLGTISHYHQCKINLSSFLLYQECMHPVELKAVLQRKKGMKTCLTV